MQDPYGALIALVLFDKKLRSYEQEVVFLKRNLEEITVSHQASVKAFNLLQQSYIGLLKRQDELDLELKASMQESNRLSRILEQASSVKEIAAVTNEKKRVVEQSLELEQTIEQVWDQLVHIEQDLAASREALAQKTVDYERLVSEVLKQIEAQEVLIARIKQERVRYCQAVPDALRTPYERMLSQMANPYVPLLEDVCGGCGGAVSRVDCADVEKHKLVACQYCCRMLYDAHVDEVYSCS
jgi:predicted  nucleic acid-binding Zn-ribbon protein